MKSQTWFHYRAVNRLVQSEKYGNVAVNQVVKIYETALRKLNDDLLNVYGNYSKQTGLGVDELSQIISGSDRANFLLSIQKNMKKLGFNVNDVYDPNYIARISRIDALKQQIYWELSAIAPDEKDATGRTYKRIIDTTYKSAQRDLALGLNITPAFADIEPDMINLILNQKWYGSNYSDKIYKNVNDLASILPEELGSALISGQSYVKTSKVIMDRMGVGKSNATRLIRTESNFFHNQAEFQSYIDDGFNYYKYTAHLDNKTSQMCENHNNKVYRVKDAIVGENYPPLHPNCRSTTVIITDEEVESGKYTVQKVNKEELEDNENKNRIYWRDRMSNKVDASMDTMLPADITPTEKQARIADINNVAKTSIPIAGTDKIVSIDDLQSKMLEAKNVKVTKPIKGDRSTSIPSEAMACYKLNLLDGTHSIIIRPEYIKATKPDMFNHIFNHEFGHYVDRVARIGRYFKHDELLEVLKGTEQSQAILGRTMMKLADFSEQETVNYFSGKQVIKEARGKKQSYELTDRIGTYMNSNSEIFANAYSLYKTEPEWLQENAPDYLKIVERVENKSKLLLGIK